MIEYDKLHEKTIFQIVKKRTLQKKTIVEIMNELSQEPRNGRGKTMGKLSVVDEDGAIAIKEFFDQFGDYRSGYKKALYSIIANYVPGYFGYDYDRMRNAQKTDARLRRIVEELRSTLEDYENYHSTKKKTGMVLKKKKKTIDEIKIKKKIELG